MKIDAAKSVPKYVQLKEIVKTYLKDEEYKANQRIPSETELMEQFDVSRNTVRQALAELVEEGIIYKKHRSGTFFSGKTNGVQKHSHLIGVMIPFLSAYIYPQIIQGIDDTAHERSYNIVLASSKGDVDKEMTSLHQLLERGVDGLLVEPAGGFQRIQESKTFQALKKLSIPVVFMDWVIEDPAVSYVSINDIQGGFAATEYLIQAGHTRIGCIYPKDHIPSIQRHRGYRSALEQHNIEYDPDLVKTLTVARWDEEHAHVGSLVNELLESGEKKPSAIFFFNDEAALAGYTAIRGAGLTIPDDMSVMGFDDSELVAVPEISLTTVIHPKYLLGKWAADMLLEEIESETPIPPRQMLINPLIAVRKSVKVLR